MKGSLALHGTDVRSPPPSNLTLPRSPAGTNNKRMLELICLLVQARTARLGRARGASSDLILCSALCFAPRCLPPVAQLKTLQSMPILSHPSSILWDSFIPSGLR